MYDAFNVSLALDKTSYKIESIFAHGQKLFVGTSTGVLHVYEVKEPLEDRELKVELKETQTFSKKPIEQLDIIKEINVLVSLSDGYVNIYDLRTFELQRQLAKTRGANIFAIDTHIEISEDEGSNGIPMIVTRLAVGVKRKLLVFTWRDTEFTDTQELQIPDKIKKMVWVSGDKVCLGLTNEYTLINVNSGTITELFAPSTPGSASFSSYMGMSISANMGMTIGARVHKPLVTKLPNNEMLLVKDNMGIFVGLDGTPTRKTRIDWSGTPEEIGFSYPYLIAILPKHVVEIRNISTQNLVQTVELPQARFINQGKYLFVASSSNAWKFIPLNFEKQIDQLVEQNEFEEALSLTEQIESILLNDKDAKLQEIRRLHAHYLFHQNKFDDAITIFQELEMVPTEVIALYPPSISGALYKPVQRPKIIEPLDEVKDKSEISNDQEEIKVSEDKIEPETSEILEGKLLEEAVQVLIRFLTDRRQKLSKVLNQQVHKTNESASQSNQTNLVNGNLDHILKLAELVDTTLLKSYMVTNDALVGPLLRVNNYCNVEEVEGLLLERKKYRELKDLYHGKGLHRKSLELLKKLGQSSEGSMKGTFQTVYYLQRLGSDHFDLILEYATWVLQANSDAGMEVFIGDHPEVENLPRDKVLKYLEDFSHDLCIKYLEHIIYELKDPTPDYHNKLIFKFLAKIESQKQELNSEGGGEIEDTNKRLLKFLDNSTHYKAEKILGRLPLDDFYEVRAILLSRLGQHDKALNIYVHKIKDEKLAEEYCIKNYIETDDPTKNVFISLLKVYLQPSNGEKLMLEPAIRLLSRHGSHVSASDALNMLPLTTKVSELYQFVEKYIRENNKNRNMNMVVKNLLKADQRQVEEQLIFYRSRRVKIDEDKMCPQCTRRIGHSVFAVFPNGVVVHYHCKDKYSQSHDTSI